jgi:hypothetical protein
MELTNLEQDVLDTIRRDKGGAWFRPQDLNVFRPGHLCRDLADKGYLQFTLLPPDMHMVFRLTDKGVDYDG